MAIFHLVPKGDLALRDGDFVFLRGGPEEVRQRIMRRFRFFRGEWFLDTRVGVPYFQSVLGRNPNTTAIGALFRRVVLTTPGVIALTSFRLVYDESTRTLSFDFRAKVDGGEIVVAPNDPNFIYDVEGMQWAE